MGCGYSQPPREVVYSTDGYDPLCPASCSIPNQVVLVLNKHQSMPPLWQPIRPENNLNLLYHARQGTFPLLSDEWCKMATALGRIADISEAEVGGATLTAGLNQTKRVLYATPAEQGSIVGPHSFACLHIFSNLACLLATSRCTFLLSTRNSLLLLYHM